ncbi:MAG: oligopeptide/dipeptide transporter, ATP-binding, C-terminal domain protein [Glaciihabitans sp.]|nr:oligopeptide/dipeptide transporter, ATP-binding, C-terminal domain protein [Glaciihabitans sp.]
MTVNADISRTRLPIMRVQNVTKTFSTISAGRRTHLTAVDQLDFTIAAGETIALVGESGSGKSTAAKCVADLLAPTEGTISMDGAPTIRPGRRARRRDHRRVQLVFQDPNGSLDPRQTVRQVLEEPLRNFFGNNRGELRRRVRELLADVELDESLLNRRPRELSGGQKQRLGLARALAVEPEIIVLDEPTASLDVSTRGQMLALLERVQRHTDVAYLLVSHDLAVVQSLADRVLVMYLGSIIESGPTDRVFTNPQHPYTKALIEAAPKMEYRALRSAWRLDGEIPSPTDRPSGCLLTNRCPVVQPDCHAQRPPLVAVDADHLSACIHPELLSAPSMDARTAS